MTPYKNFSQNNTWTSRARKGALYLAVSAMLAVPTGCGSDNNGSDWEETTVEEPTKGVVTTVEETEPGKFTVVDEQVAETRDQSRVIVRHLDGKVDTMTLAQAKGMVGNQDTVRQTTVVHHHGGGFGLGHILWWSAMGHMMGRGFGSPAQSYVYRDSRVMGNASSELRRTSVSRTVKVPARGRSGFFKGFGSRSGG
ncbi:MAG TPA: hypothetical protein PLO67_09380 [Saprospiraceae bacterium]|nr:hypothetical protein [Saprospiraceae bacterium]HPI06117.1 hypothetical protein [Saprospiraceae bacterium]